MHKPWLEIELENRNINQMKKNYVIIVFRKFAVRILLKSMWVLIFPVFGIAFCLHCDIVVKVQGLGARCDYP
jgi:hypothetical protein